MRGVFSSLSFVVVVMSVTAALPAFALVAMLVADARDNAVRDARGRAVDAARIAVGVLDDPIRSAELMLAMVAQAEDIFERSPACNRTFARIVREVPDVSRMVVGYASGEILCSSAPDLVGSAIGSPVFVQRAVRRDVGRFADHAAGRNSPLGAIGVWRVIHDAAGEPDLLLAASIDLPVLARRIVDLELPRGTIVTLIDRQGTVLVRHPSPEGRVGASFRDAPIVRAMLDVGQGTAEAAGLDGVDRLYAFRSLAPDPEAPVVSVGIDSSEIFREADAAVRRGIAAGTIALVLVVTAALVGSEALVSRPIRSVVRAAERLRSGDLGSRVRVGRRDELGSLGRAFNDMADRLKAMLEGEHAAKQSLEARVAELVSARTRESDRLNRLVETLQACLTEAEGRAAAGDFLPRFFPDTAGALYMIAPSRDDAEAVAIWGEPSELRRYFGLDDCWALRRGRSFAWDDRGGGVRCGHLSDPPPSRTLCVPLAAQSETLGVLHLESRTGDAVDERLATTVADQLALALANLRLRDTLRNQSIRDPLTGLYNRRFTEEAMQKILRQAERNGSKVGLIALDIDHFKRFNDTFGHDGGDAVLKALGEIMRRHTRGGDIAARLGGEEFAFVLVDASTEGTVAKAEALRAATRALKLSHRGRSLGDLSISAGVAEFPDHGSEAEDLMKAADEALYRAKQEGRDRVVVTGT